MDSKYKVTSKISKSDILFVLIWIGLFALLFFADFAMTFFAFQYALPFGVVYSMILALAIIIFFNFSFSISSFFRQSNKLGPSLFAVLAFLIALIVNVISNIVGFSAENILKEECDKIMIPYEYERVEKCEALNRNVAGLLKQSDALLTIETGHRGGIGPFSKGIKDAMIKIEGLRIPCKKKVSDFSDPKKDDGSSAPEKNNVLKGSFFANMFGKKEFSCTIQDDFNEVQNAVIYTNNRIKDSHANLIQICENEIRRFKSFNREDSLKKTGYVDFCNSLKVQDSVEGSEAEPEKQKKDYLIDENIEDEDVPKLFSLFWGSFTFRWPFSRFIEHLGFGFILVFLLLLLELFASTKIVNFFILRKLWEKETQRLLKDIDINPQFTADKIEKALQMILKDSCDKKDISEDKDIEALFEKMVPPKIVAKNVLSINSKNYYSFSYFYRHWLKDDFKDELQKILKIKRKEELGHKFDEDQIPSPLKCQDDFLKFLEDKTNLNQMEIEFTYKDFVKILEDYKENKDGTCVLSINKDKETLFFAIKDKIKPLLEQFDEEVNGDTKLYLGDYFIRRTDRNSRKITVFHDFFTFIKDPTLFEYLFKPIKQNKSESEKKFIDISKRIRLEEERSEANFKTIEEGNQVLRVLEKEGVSDYYALNIARFHLKAAKSYSHEGKFEAVKKHISYLEVLVNDSDVANIRKERAPFLLEARRIEANAWADLFEIDKAIKIIEDSITAYGNEDLECMKSFSALGRILILEGKYDEAVEMFAKVIKRINRSEVLQPRIHLITALAWSRKNREAINEYNETLKIMDDGYNYFRKEKSLEYLNVSGCEIVLMNPASKRERILITLNNLPKCFETDRSNRYHNQMFLHYRYLIDWSTKKKFDSKERHSFYLDLTDIIKEEIKEEVNIITLIRLGMVGTYLYMIQNEQKVSGKYLDEITEKFQISFKKEIDRGEGRKLNHVYSKYHNTIKDDKTPFKNKSALIKMLKDVKYIVPKV